MLPTQKPHVSFSEVREWAECSFRHKLKFVDKIKTDAPDFAPAMSFGTACHAACEDFMRTRNMKPELALAVIDNEWLSHSDVGSFTPEALIQAKQDARSILLEVPAFMDNTFPGWEFVEAEFPLYEHICGHDDVKFKGFIDGIIKSMGKRNEELRWIIDWKTTAKGWFRDKREDEITRSQVVLYKRFWIDNAQPGVPEKNIRCGFVLLKRSAKPGEHCEFFPVAAGPVTVTKSLRVLNNMITSVKRGIAIKNRSSCTYCDYRDTQHCT
jgi:hypothetical protein